MVPRSITSPKEPEESLSPHRQEPSQLQKTRYSTDASCYRHHPPTPVHVLHVPKTAVVLQSPHLVAGPVLLVRHPDVVLVRLHSQHSPSLQHGLNIMPRSCAILQYHTFTEVLLDSIFTWLLRCWGFSCRAEPNKSTDSIRSQVVINDS